MATVSSSRTWPVALAVAVLVATACAPATSGTVAPAVKQELTIVQGADADSLDPHGPIARPTLNVIQQFAEALTKITWPENGESTIAPQLATSWTALNDTTWQFKLRQGVKFHNGEAFDAGTVKYSFERILGPDGGASKKYAASVSRVDVLDPYTVNIITKTPTPLPPVDFSQVFMVPPKYAAEVGAKAYAVKPVGTGPFKFVEWVKDDHITLEANPDYWGGRPKLDKVTVRPIPEATTRSAAIETGRADVATPIAVASVAALKQRSGLKVVDSVSARTMYVQFDQANDPIMKNVLVRQALNYAVDKDAIVAGIYQGQATVLAGQDITPAYFGFNPNIKAYPYDAAKAKQLLAQAGYPNGFDFTILTPRGTYSGDYETAQAVAGQLEKVGVRTTVKVLEFAVYIADWGKKKLTPAFLAAIATYPDADATLDHFVDTGTLSTANVPELNALVKQERATLDREKRRQVLQQAMQVQHDQALALYLHALRNFVAVSDHVQGFRLFANEGFDLYGVSMK